MEEKAIIDEAVSLFSAIKRLYGKGVIAVSGGGLTDIQLTEELFRVCFPLEDPDEKGYLRATYKGLAFVAVAH